MGKFRAEQKLKSALAQLLFAPWNPGEVEIEEAQGILGKSQYRIDPMKKLYVTVIVLALFILALVTNVTASPVSSTIGDWPYSTSLGLFRLYIPFVSKGNVLPTPTLVPTAIPTVIPTLVPTAIPTATPTAIPYSPIPIGAGLHFLGWENNTRLSGVVIKAEFKQALTDYWGDVYTPGGTFLIVIMDVTNNGLVSDSISRIGAFKVKDTAGRLFDMANLSVQMAANDTYNLKGVYDDIQPGFTTRMVFVFDVVPGQYFTLVSLNPW